MGLDAVRKYYSDKKYREVISIFKKLDITPQAVFSLV